MKFIKQVIQYLRSLNKTQWAYSLILLYIFVVLINYIKDFSTDIEGWEFAFINHIQLIKKFNALYSDTDQFPYKVVYYPPLYPYTLDRLCRIFKIDSFKSMHEILVNLRIISLIFALASSYLMVRIISIFSLNKHSKLLLILTLVLLPLHLFSARPDAIKLFLFILFLKNALLYFFTAEKKKTTLISACFCAVLGIFFKHDITPYILLFFFIHYIIFRDNRTQKALLYFSGIFLIFFVLFKISLGEFFIKNIIYSNIQYSGDLKLNLYFITLNTLKLSPFIYTTYKNSLHQDKKVKFIAILSFSYFLLSSMALLRVGSNLNYTYESIFLFLINFGIYLDAHPLKYKYQPFLLIFYLYLFNSYLKDPVILNKSLQLDRKAEYFQNIETSNIIKSIIGKDTVFIPNGKYILFYAESNLIYGYDLHLDRFFELYENLKITSAYHENKTLNEYDSYFTDGRVSYIIVENNAKAIKQIDKYYKNYYFYKKVNNILLFKYKPV